MHTRHLYFVDNHYCQYYNELILFVVDVVGFHYFHIWFFHFQCFQAILLSHVLKAQVSGLNFKCNSIFTFQLRIPLLIDYQYFLHAFSKSTQNNLEYLIQIIIHWVVQIYHSMLKLMIYCYCIVIVIFYICIDLIMLLYTFSVILFD